MASKESKVKALFTDIKTHWSKPAPGKYVPYREYLDILIGSGSNYAGSKILEYIAFGAGCYLMMYHYKLPYITYSVIGLINMPLGYLWAILWWIVSDNLGFLPKKTEKKLYGVYIGAALLGIFMILFNFEPYLNPHNPVVAALNSFRGISAASSIKILGTFILNSGWKGARNIFWRKKLIPKFGRYKYSLYCDYIPMNVMVILIGWLPLYNIQDEVTRVWVANLLFAIYCVYGFGNNLEMCCQNISPNSRERIFVRSYPIKLSHLFYSIIAILVPVFIGMTKDKWADIAVFRWIIPGIFFVFSTLTVLLAGRIKERIPQPPLEKKVNIKLWDGMFGVMRNKYKWTLTIVGLLDSLGNGMLAFTTILYLYTFRLSGLAYSLIVALVSFAGTPPDFLTPYFIKRFSYKQIMIFHQYTRAVGYTIIVLCYLFLGHNLKLCGIISVVMLFLMEMCKTVPTAVGHDMDIRISDYQMYLSGERLENFSGVFGWFTGPITTFVGLIIPLLMLKGGFNSNFDILFIDESRRNIIVIPIIMDIIGYVLMSIPYFFWDYDDEKQNKVIEVLRRREEVTRKQMESGDDSSPEENVAAMEEKTAEPQAVQEAVEVMS